MRVRITRALAVAATSVAMTTSGLPAAAVAAAPGEPTGEPTWELRSVAWSEPVRLSTASHAFAGLEVAPDGYATTAFREGGTEAAPLWATYERQPRGPWTRVADGVVAEETEYADDSEGWRRWSTLETGERRWRIQRRPIGGSFETTSRLMPPSPVAEGDTWLHDDFLLARGRSVPAVLSVSAMPAGGYRTGLLNLDHDGEWSSWSGFRTTEGDPAFHAGPAPFGEQDPSRTTRAAWVRSGPSGQELVVSGFRSDLEWAPDVASPISTPAPVVAVGWAGDATVLLWMDAARTRLAAVTLDGSGRPGPVIDLGSVRAGSGGVRTAYANRARQDALVWVTADGRLEQLNVRRGLAPVRSQVATDVSRADIAVDGRGNALIAWTSTADDDVHYVLDWVGAGRSPELTVPGVDVRDGLGVGTVSTDQGSAFTLVTDTGLAADLPIPVSATRVELAPSGRWLPHGRVTYRADTSWTVAQSFLLRAQRTMPTSSVREPVPLGVDRAPAGTIDVEPGATYCVEVRPNAALPYVIGGQADPWSTSAPCVTAPYPATRLQRDGGWQRRHGALVTRQRGATLTWPGMLSAREVALRVRPSAARVTVELGGRTVGTKRLSRRVVRIGALKRPVTNGGKLVITVRSKGEPVRIESVYVTR